jgi:hypothetical protein
LAFDFLDEVTFIFFAGTLRFIAVWRECTCGHGELDCDWIEVKVEAGVEDRVVIFFKMEGC